MIINLLVITFLTFHTSTLYQGDDPDFSSGRAALAARITKHFLVLNHPLRQMRVLWVHRVTSVQVTVREIKKSNDKLSTSQNNSHDSGTGTDTVKSKQKRLKVFKVKYSGTFE